MNMKKFETKVIAVIVLWFIIGVVVFITPGLSNPLYMGKVVTVYPLLAGLYLAWDYYFSGNYGRTKKPFIDYLLLLIFLFFTIPVFAATAACLCHSIAGIIFFFWVKNPPFLECIFLTVLSVILGVILKKGLKENSLFYFAGIPVIYIAHLINTLFILKL